jgi:serine/threonine-protein kinase
VARDPRITAKEAMAEPNPPGTSDVTPDSSGRMAGEYRLGRKLGEGGFGAVYEAEHPLLKRRAAVKVLHRVAEHDSDAVQRFISEAQAVNQIRSPHIVDIFSFGKLADGRHFYVMDLLEGEPLDRYLERVTRVDVATTVRLLRPIAAALDVAHAAGIVHRDLKPQNIFLAWDAAGQVVPKLLDFGMAKLIGDVRVHTVSGTPMGTPLYMSPEQALGHKVDQRSDVYALGVLCHELLTGSVPLIADTTIGVLMAHISKAPPTASSVWPELPPELDAPLLKMLDKEPTQRPASAGEALAALALAAEGAGTAIPTGLPFLPPPAPPPASARPGELSNTFAAESPSEQKIRAASGRAAAAGSVPEREPRGARLGWLGLTIVLVGAALYFAIGAKRAPDAREQGGGAAASQAGNPAPTNEPKADMPTTLPRAEPPQNTGVEPRPVAGSATPSEQAVSPEAGARPNKRKKEGGGAPRKAAIPSDLENPF